MLSAKPFRVLLRAPANQPMLDLHRIVVQNVLLILIAHRAERVLLKSVEILVKDLVDLTQNVGFKITFLSALVAQVLLVIHSRSVHKLSNVSHQLHPHQILVIHHHVGQMLTVAREFAHASLTTSVIPIQDVGQSVP